MDDKNASETPLLDLFYDHVFKNVRNKNRPQMDKQRITSMLEDLQTKAEAVMKEARDKRSASLREQPITRQVRRLRFKGRR